MNMLPCSTREQLRLIESVTVQTVLAKATQAALRKYGAIERRNLVISVPNVHGPLPEIADGPAAELVRLIFHSLRFDENQPFALGLDHKLVQALVFNDCVPQLFPETHGFRSVVQIAYSERLPIHTVASMLFPSGYIVKRTLSAGSGEGGRIDCLDEALDWASKWTSPRDLECDAIHEQWIMQDRIAIRDEFRAHSIEDHVPSDLIDFRYTEDTDIQVTDRQHVSQFLHDALRRLPRSLVDGTMYAWDIARQPDGTLIAIEVNIAGMHTRYRPGFQCSGFFQEPDLGPDRLLQLLRFIRNAYGLELAFPSSTGSLNENLHRFFADRQKTVPTTACVLADGAATIDGKCGPAMGSEVTRSQQ